MLRQLQLAVHRRITTAGKMKHKEITFRKMVMTVPAVFAGAGMYTALVVGAFSNPMGSDFIGAVIISAFIYFFWLIGWHSAVRLDAVGVRVDNFIVRHLIPWEELADIAVGSGLEFRLRNGGKVRSLMYGGSLIGMILGYKYTRRVAARMRTATAEMAAAAPKAREPLAYQSRYYVSPWPPLAILAATEVVAVLALTTR